MKRLSIFTFIVFFMFTSFSLFAQEELKSAQIKASEVTPENFQEYAAANVGTQVEIKGMVVHVCKHGGKKMFIIGEDPEKRVKITATDKVTVFDSNLEGNLIFVKGIVEPIEEEVVSKEEKHEEDADHKNYYHVPQYAIGCSAFSVLD